jgi:hypothetical protein
MDFILFDSIEAPHTNYLGILQYIFCLYAGTDGKENNRRVGRALPDASQCIDVESGPIGESKNPTGDTKDEGLQLNSTSTLLVWLQPIVSAENCQSFRSEEGRRPDFWQSFEDKKRRFDNDHETRAFLPSFHSLPLFSPCPPLLLVSEAYTLNQQSEEADEYC